MFAEFEKEEMLNDEDLYINAMNNDSARACLKNILNCLF